MRIGSVTGSSHRVPSTEPPRHTRASANDGTNLRHRILQLEGPLLPEHEGGDARDRLRHRVDAEDRVGLDRAARPRGRAGRSARRRPPGLPRHHDRPAGEEPVVDVAAGSGARSARGGRGRTPPRRARPPPSARSRPAPSLAVRSPGTQRRRRRPERAEAAPRGARLLAWPSGAVAAAASTYGGRGAGVLRRSRARPTGRRFAGRTTFTAAARPVLAGRSRWAATWSSERATPRRPTWAGAPRFVLRAEHLSEPPPPSCWLSCVRCSSPAPASSSSCSVPFPPSAEVEPRPPDELGPDVRAGGRARSTTWCGRTASMPRARRHPVWPLAERAIELGAPAVGDSPTSCCPTAGRLVRRRPARATGAARVRHARRAPPSPSSTARSRRSGRTPRRAALADDQLAAVAPRRRRERGSSPRPARARPGSSPSGPGCCSTAGGSPPPRCASWRSTSGPRRRCAQRTPDLPGLHVRTLNALGLAILNGQRPFARRGRGAWSRSTSRGARGSSAASSSSRSAATSTRWRPGSRRSAQARLGLRAPAASRQATTARSTGFAAIHRRATGPSWPGAAARLRRADPRRHRAAPHRSPEARRRGPARPAGSCWSTSSRTSRRRTSCSCACSPRRAARCSASATTTRRSTATTAPTRAGSSTSGRCSPAPATTPLEVNYRCPEGVVTAADRAPAAQPASGRQGDPGGQARRRSGW